MSVPSTQELLASPEFRQLPPPRQQQIIALHSRQLSGPAAAQERLGGAPVAGNEDQQEDSAVESASQETPIAPRQSGGKSKLPFAWKELADDPLFAKLSPEGQARLKRRYYEQIEAPAGISPNDSQTAPGMTERFVGGVRGVIGSFQKTAGVLAGQPSWIQSGEEQQRVDQETGYQLPESVAQWWERPDGNTLDMAKHVLTKYLPQAMPYIAGAWAGGKLGAAVGAVAGIATGPGEAVAIPAGAIIGATLGLFGIGVFQSIGDAHQEYLAKHPGDYDGAFTYTAERAGLNGIVAALAEPLGLIGSGAAAKAIAKSLTGASVSISKEAALAPVKRALVQLAVQGSTGVGGQALGNAIQKNEDPDARLTQGLAEAGLAQLAFALPGIIRAVRVTRGAVVHAHEAARQEATDNGVQKEAPGIQWDASTGMRIDPHDLYPTKEGPTIDPGTGMETPAGRDVPGAEDWRRRTYQPAREAPKIDQGQAEWVGQPQQTVKPVPQEPARAGVPAGIEIDPSTGMEMPIGGTLIDSSTGMDVPPYATPHEVEAKKAALDAHRAELAQRLDKWQDNPKIGKELIALKQEGGHFAAGAKDLSDLRRAWDKLETPEAKQDFIAGLPEEALPHAIMVSRTIEEGGAKAVKSPEKTAAPEPNPVKGTAMPEAGAAAEEQRPIPLKERIAAKKVPKEAPGAEEKAPVPAADDKAFEAALTAPDLRTSLLAKARRLTGGDREAAKDLVQTTLAKAWEKRAKFTPREDYTKNLASWVRTMMKNQNIDEIRATQSRPQGHLDAGADLDVLSSEPGQEKNLQSRAPTWKPAEPGTLDALRSRATAMLGDSGPRIELAHKLTDGAAGEYDSAAKVIRLAFDASEPTAALDHEAWHAAKEMLNPLEKRVIEGKFREGGKWHQRVEKALSGEQYERARQQLNLQDEREAYGFQLYRQGKFQADTAIGRIFDHMVEHFERIRNWVSGSGFKSAGDVFRALSEGRLRERSAAYENVGIQPSAPKENASPVQTLGPTASQRREAFRKRAEPTGTTAQEKAESVRQAAEGEGPADPYTRGVNTSVLNHDTEAKNRITQAMAAEFGQYFEKQRGGNVSWRESYAAGERYLRENPDYLTQLMRERGRKATTAPEQAARMMLEDASLQYLKDHTADAGGSLEKQRDWMFSLSQHELLQGKVRGSESEAGRVLNLIKSRPEIEKLRGIALKKKLEEFHAGKYDAFTLAQAIQALDDPAKIRSFLQDVWKPKWWHYPMEVRMNAMLSSPAILYKKTITDGILRALAGPEDVVASMFGRIRGGPDRAYATDALARWRGVLSSSLDSFSAAKGMWKTGQSNFETREVRHAIPGKIGEWIRMPGKAIEFVNEFARMQAYSQEVQALANRTAIREGLRGDSYWARYNELVAHPTEAIRMKAFEAGQYRTAQAELGEFGKRFQGLINSNPITKTIFPFVKTPINLLKLGAERGPLALAMPEFWKAYREGGIARDYALSKLSIGTAATVALAALAHQGYITGTGPSDSKELALKRLSGPSGGEQWQPTSVLIGDRYYNMGSIEPLGNQLALIANFVNLHGHMKEGEADKFAGAIIGSVMKTVVSRTYFQGLADVIQAMTDPDRHGASFVGTLAASFVPSVVAQTNRYFDPQMREAQGVLDVVKARIPGLAQTMPLRYDVRGQPIEQSKTLAGLPYMPIYTSRGKPADEVANRIQEAGATLQPVSRKINKWDLTPEQHSEYAQLAGERLWPMLERVTSQASFDRMTPDVQQRVIRRVEAMAHKIATLQMKREYPDLRRPPRKEAS
jgi:DNA-directed RNA polymerase specialized sigma24 family protein